MATANAPTPRASLLAGLRTGGVRSASANMPQTAAPGTSSFNIPRIVTPQNEDLYIQEEEDELPNMMAQNLYIRNNAARIHQHPMTAAVDGAANRFAQQQATGMMSPGMNFPMTPAAAQTQLQALQLQMMQMEIARLQVSLRPLSAVHFLSFITLSNRTYRLSSTKLSCLLKPRLKRSASVKRSSSL